MLDRKLLMRACLWYDFKQKKSATESFRTLSEVFGDEALSKTQVWQWFKRFKSGDESLEDHDHGHQPQSVDNEILKQVVESDPTQTTRELAVQFQCSHTTIETHLHSIGKRIRYGKWVPHQLTDANKATRVATAGILLSRSKKSGFFDSIVTGDEKWIRYDNITRKPQWLSVGEPPIPTPKPDFHGKKVMLCVWWNSKGVVYFEILDPHQTVTADLYRHQLDHVDEALRRKGVDTTTTKLLHDNARPHVAKVTSQKIEELGWEVLPCRGSRSTTARLLINITIIETPRVLIKIN